MTFVFERLFASLLIAYVIFVFTQSADGYSACAAHNYLQLILRTRRSSKPSRPNITQFSIYMCSI